MTGRAVRLLALLSWLVAGPIAQAQNAVPRELAIAFIERSGDPAYQATRGYAGLFRREQVSPFPAAELGIAGGTAASRARGFRLTLARKILAEAEDAT